MPRTPFQSRHLNTFAGGVYEWIGRISHKHRELTDLQPSDNIRDELWERTQVDFIRSALSLRSKRVSRDEVERAITSEKLAEGLEPAGFDDSVRELASALKKVRARAANTEQTGNLDLELLGALNPRNGFRTTGGSDGTEHLALAVEAACRWFDADSFRELNPVEQAALVLLRLVELRPFQASHDELALVAASLFTMRAGLPPVIFQPEALDDYRRALEAGSAMNTGPMVELIARSIEATLDAMIAGAKDLIARG